MTEFRFQAESEENTKRLGKMLADVLPDGTVIALSGTLGAGKTRLVQAVAEASGVNIRDVVSPTFVLIHEYRGRRPIYHLDVYRIRDDDEFLELGPEEYFESSGLTFVEWADRVERCLPLDYLHISIDVTGDTSRTFTVRATGERRNSVIEELAKRL
jgi:tRNA threonylcarbamoyladenosine biosynthesis protein TsaE